MSYLARRSQTAVYLVLACCALPSLASAAAAAPQSPVGVDEVVVTARKITETVHDAPATIAVVSSKRLETLAITNPNELNGAVPGLLIQTGIGGNPGVSLRGLGSNAAVFSIEASVALFVDGVYSAHLRDYVTPIYDLDHIELVKGTQGTLLGKNTSLGAISMVTRKPTAVREYRLSTSYDFTTRSPRLEGALNLPISDTFALRVAGLYSNAGGYVRNSVAGRREPQVLDASGRVEARWTPNATFDLLLSGQYDKHEGRGQELELLRDASAGTTVASWATAVGQTGFESRPDRRTESDSQAFGAAAAGPRPFDHQTSRHYNALATWDLGDVTVTSQSALSGYILSRLNDLDFTRANLFNLNDNERDLRISQELRVASAPGRKLGYLFGAFFLNDDWTLNRILTGNAPSPLTGTAESDFQQKTQSLSAFGQLTYQLSDKLTGTAGLRYTDETKRGTFFRARGTGTLALVAPPITTTTLTIQEQDLDGDLGLQYRLDASRLFYASLSKGSKGGGFQNAPTTVAGAPYKGEQAYTAELGSKLLFDRGSLDVAVFQEIVRGFQFTHISLVGTPPVAQTIVDNSNVRSRGFEVNGAWRATDDLRFDGGVVYAEAVATATAPAPPLPAVQVNGLVQPRAPKWTGNLNASYSHPITGDLTFGADADLVLSSKAYLQPNIGGTLGAPARGGYTQVNLRASVGDSKAGWEVAALVKNLTNVTQPTFVSSVSATGLPNTNTAAYYGTMMPPREYLVQFTYRH
jgi:outer membrane receptor protein involved in Fe transport